MNRAYAQMLLRELALRGAMDRYVIISTKDVGKRIGISQQSASRWLSELETEGLIRRERFGKNMKVKITPAGINILKRIYYEYSAIFGIPKIIKLKGTVISGLGEGRYYIMKEGYRSQIREKLMFDPYPGTLNIKVYPNYVDNARNLREANDIILKGFVENGRKFGDVRAFFATIEGYMGALIIPEMSHYKDIVEIIADVSLREKFRLKDGDEVEINVYLLS